MRARDGHPFTGYLTLPESGSGPGMVVAQEIFGVTDYIKDVCARLSELGYVALAPDLYSRIDGEIGHRRTHGECTSARVRCDAEARLPAGCE